MQITSCWSATVTTRCSVVDDDDDDALDAIVDVDSIVVVVIAKYIDTVYADIDIAVVDVRFEYTRGIILTDAVPPGNNVLRITRSVRCHTRACEIVR
jgi:hypothetical protein